MMNLTYQMPPSKPIAPPAKPGDDYYETDKEIEKQQKTLRVFFAILAFVVFAVLWFFVLKGRHNLMIIYFKNPFLAFVANVAVISTFVFLCLLIAGIGFAKKVLIILGIVDAVLIILLLDINLWGEKIITLFRKTGSSTSFFFKNIFDDIGRAFCYLKPENIATGNKEECEPEDAEKEGKYENLEVVFGIKDKGKVEDTNVQPVSEKPYKLDMTLTNLNSERKIVFQGSIYEIKVKKIEGYASAYSFTSVDFSDNNIPTDAEYNKEFKIEPGYSEWIRLEFDELPCCLGKIYFHTRVTTEQTGSGKSTIGIVPYKMEEEAYSDFVRTFDKSASMSPGPVNVYVLSSPAIISQPDLGSDTFSIILKIKNKLDKGSAKLLNAKIIPPFDYIDITECSSSDTNNITFSKCSDVSSNCVEIALEDKPIIKSLQTFEIECQARILKSKYNEYEKKGLISTEVIYEYTIENDYSKKARCDCSPSGNGLTSLTTTGTSGSCADLTEKCPTEQKLIDKIVCEAKKAGVPADIMLGIAKQESGLNHCDSSGNVKTGDGGRSIGLMQVSQCSDTGDVHNINNNIICGIKHLKEKCTYSYVSSLNNGVGICNPTGLCTDSGVKCQYKCAPYQGCSTCSSSYEKTYSGWDIAIRGYNGWGCGPFEANRKYVELVKQYAAQYRNYV